MDANERLASARTRVAAAEAELRAANTELHEATIAASRFKVGQIWVRPAGRWVARRGQVTGFTSQWGTLPILTLFKKDGTLGKQTHELWDASAWTLESDVPAVATEEW